MVGLLDTLNHGLRLENEGLCTMYAQCKYVMIIIMIIIMIMITIMLLIMIIIVTMMLITIETIMIR